MDYQKKKNLTEAFEDLEKNYNIIARENWQCCNTCGWAAMADVQKENPDAKGAVFYHAQATENLEDSGRCFLNFGSFNDSVVDTIKLGCTIAQVLRQHNLFVDWDYTAFRKIGVDIH